MTETEQKEVVRATVRAITKLLWILAFGIWFIVAAIDMFLRAVRS